MLKVKYSCSCLQLVCLNWFKISFAKKRCAKSWRKCLLAQAPNLYPYYFIYLTFCHCIKLNREFKRRNSFYEAEVHIEVYVQREHTSITHQDISLNFMDCMYALLTQFMSFNRKWMSSSFSAISIQMLKRFPRITLSVRCWHNEICVGLPYRFICYFSILFMPQAILLLGPSRANIEILCSATFMFRCLPASYQACLCVPYNLLWTPKKPCHELFGQPSTHDP